MLYFLYLYFTSIRYGINLSYGDLILNRGTEHKAHRKRRDNKILFINNNIPIMPYPFVEHIPNKWWHGSSLSCSYYYIVTCNQPKSFHDDASMSLSIPSSFESEEGSRHFPLCNHNQLGLIHYFAWSMITLKNSFQTITNPNKIMIVV